MRPYRGNALVAGILLVAGTATALMVGGLTSPILDAPDYVARIAANPGQLVSASFLYFVMAVSCAGIGLALYPILKSCREDLAIGAAGFRIIEGTIQIAGSASLVGLLALGQAYAQAGGAQAAQFQVIGAVIQATSNWLANGPMLLSWGIAALMYYGVFYQFRLVPRWLSIWGLAGISLTIVACILVMLNLLPSFGTVQNAANLPIAVQEMVFAAWLIFKGVNPAAADPRTSPRPYSKKGALNESSVV